jgi:hypothetical protein
MSATETSAFGPINFQPDAQCGKQEIHPEGMGPTGGARWPATKGPPALDSCSLTSGQPHDGSSRVVPVFIGRYGLRLESA